MSHKNSRRLFYFLRRIITLGGTGGYILWNTGIFQDQVTTSGVTSAVYIVLGGVGIALIRDYHKRATNEQNPDIGQLTRATALSGMIPWIIIVIVAAALKVGLANMFQHLVVISSLQIGGKIFLGFEMKYDLYMIRRIPEKEKKPKIETEVTDV